MRKTLTAAFRSRLSEERGIALILTLAIIALVTLVLIAFVASMRVENSASKSFNDLIKARELALGAVDQAVATIRQATAERSENPVSTYATFPGVVWTNFNGVFGPVYLFSAPASVIAGPVSPATTNLNAGFWITGSNNVEFTIEADSQINVGWLYVAEDGTVGLPPLPAVHGALVGRFAFWADDEASKINLNTAGTPTVTAPPPPPDYGTSVSNDVDLSVLLPGLNTLTAAITARQVPPFPGYTTIEEVKLADTAPIAPSTADSDFNTNRFYLTTYSNDANYPLYQDDLNSLNLPRLVLANIHDLPADSDILGTAGASVSNALTYLSAPALATMLSASATPNAFADKYNTVTTPNGLKQVIANIIAYQLDPKSTTLFSKMPGDPSSPPTYLGLAKTPYINEVKISYAITADATPPAVDVTRTIQVELFYIYDGTYTTGNESIQLNNLPSDGGPTPKILSSETINAASLPVGLPVGQAFLSGTYAVFTVTDPQVTLPGPLSVPLPLTGPIQVQYFRKNGLLPAVRLDYASMLLTPVTLDPTINAAAWHGAQAADPCVNDTDSTWEKYSNVTTPLFAGTLTPPNNANQWQSTNPGPSGGPVPATYPFSAGADVSKAIMRAGPMQSVGELGYIHRPEPFKHVTLQPGGGNTAANQIPDWAMLDLFTVASPPTAGRININSFVFPGFPNTNVRRLVPLKALLSSASGMIAPATFPLLPPQIYDDLNTSRSSGADPYGMKAASYDIFDTIGEICEAKGLADDATKLEVDREAAVRRIANLITVRSSTFTIWVLAQTIKQPPGSTPGTFTPGTDLITGEVKAQAVVERYESTPGVAGSVPKFRTRYFRYLYQ